MQGVSDVGLARVHLAAKFHRSHALSKCSGRDGDFAVVYFAAENRLFTQLNLERSCTDWLSVGLSIVPGFLRLRAINIASTLMGCGFDSRQVVDQELMLWVKTILAFFGGTPWRVWREDTILSLKYFI